MLVQRATAEGCTVSCRLLSSGLLSRPVLLYLCRLQLGMAGQDDIAPAIQRKKSADVLRNGLFCERKAQDAADATKATDSFLRAFESESCPLTAPVRSLVSSQTWSYMLFVT